jgi:hypothetical protein
MTRLSQNTIQPARQVPPAEVTRLLAELRAEPYARRSRWGSTARMSA